MSKSVAVVLIDAMVKHGRLSPLVAAQRKAVLDDYERQLEAIRPKVRVAARLLDLEMNDPYIIACAKCLASGRHDYDDDDFVAPDPLLATGGTKLVVRCVRCLSICEYVRNKWTRKNQNRKFPSREKGMPEDQMSDRDRYRTIKDLIEPHEASQLLDIIRFFRKLEAEARQMGIHLEPPLTLF